WRADRSEFVVAAAALIGGLGSGPLRGVIIGGLISVCQVCARGSHPPGATLGGIPGTNRFSDLERNPENESVAGISILRVESSLFYFNVEFVREAILARVRSQTPHPKLVILDFSASPFVDLQSAATL